MLDGNQFYKCRFVMFRLLSRQFYIFCITAFIAHNVDAEDWPQWRGPNRNGHVLPGTRVPSSLIADPKVIWQMKVGEGFASPVVAMGKVFYFDNQGGKETLHAIDAADHHELWRATIDDVFRDDQGPPGPRCTPLVDGDRIYAQSGKGELQCLRLTDGHLVWRANFLKDFGAAFLGEDSKIPGAAEHGYTAAPVVDGERLIACVGGTNGAGVVCFEKRSGKIIWKSQDDLAAYAAPVVATLAGVKQAVCFTVTGLIGLDLSSGKPLWRIPHKSSYGRNATTPVVMDDWVLVGSYQNGLIGVKISSDGGSLKAEEIWKNKTAAMNFSSPIMLGQYIYGLGPAKNLICVEVTTGKISWSKEGYFTTAPSVAHASFLGMGKNILVCTDGGQLALIAADAAECRELSRAQVCGLNWCNPAYANGRLYIRDGIKNTGNLFCIELLP